MADIVEPKADALYEADEHAWTEQQIAILRSGDLHRLDRVNLALYLTDMAARDRRELASRLVVLCAHILKWRIQPERAGESWRLTIREQQRAIRRLLRSLPSLRARADEILREAYPDAVAQAFDEMGSGTGADAASWSTPDLDVDGLLSFDPAPTPREP